MPSYNLIDRSWLPCITPDGHGVELSLREALLQAHEYRELYDPSPLVTVALHRLLLAVVHRAYLGPASISAWRDIWKSGRLDSDVINAYLDEQQEHGRFDLFDPDRPFYQVPYIIDLADPKKQTPIAKLAQEAAAGNNATLFDHQVDAAPVPMSAAEAARYVVAVQAFSIGFGKSFPFYLSDSTLIRGFSLLATGETLFETLALNLMPYSPFAWSEDGDHACWEREALPTPVREGTTPDGYCDFLTWQSRQVHLIPDDRGESVSRCQLRQNLKLDSNRLDPFKCYLRDDQRGFRPRSFRPERALWRDSTLLFQQSEADANAASVRPELMNWMARIEQQREQGSIEAQDIFRLRAYGLTTDDGNAASVILWRREELPLPLALLALPDAISALAGALQVAEAVGRLLNQTARHLAELLLVPMSDDSDGRKADPEQAKALARALALERRYWPRLDAPFARLITALPEDRTPDPDDPDAVVYGANALSEWAGAIDAAAREAFEETAASLDHSARSLKAVASVQARFKGRLRKMVQELVPDDAKDGGEEAA